MTNFTKSLDTEIYSSGFDPSNKFRTGRLTTRQKSKGAAALGAATPRVLHFRVQRLVPRQAVDLLDLEVAEEVGVAGADDLPHLAEDKANFLFGARIGPHLE